MTVALWCVFFAILMPYAVTLFAKRNMPRVENRAPRLYKAQLEGAQQRAVWAEANHFESFPTFAAGVIVAHIAQADQTIVDGLALGYIVARLAYFYFYISDRSGLRSLVWFVALSCVLGQFICAALTGTM
jgi:uncharacterized MAPEG superfamily protein